MYVAMDHKKGDGEMVAMMRSTKGMGNVNATNRRKDGYMYRVRNALRYDRFDINGKEIKIRFRDYIDPIFNNWWIPAKVIAEYPYFLLVEILPHTNPIESLGESKPYRIALNKVSLIIGDNVEMKVVD